MTFQDDVMKRLRTVAPSMRLQGVQAIWVFGSVARGEADEESDVDILVDLDAPVSLFEFVRLRRQLASVVGRSVDLVTRDGLRPHLRDQVMREAVRAA